MDAISANTIPDSDRGLLYGDGLFETIRLISGELSFWSWHRARLLRDCQILGIPLQRAILEQKLDQFIPRHPSDGIVKIIVTRGSSGRGYKPPPNSNPRIILQFHELSANYGRQQQSGVRVCCCKHPLSVNSRLAGIKHLGRLDQVLASSELSDAFDEGIMSTDEGNVIEGTRSNFFAVLDGQLMTPEIRLAGVKGVMRAFLMDRFSADGITVLEVALSHEELFTATELFLCNSVSGVWPVTSLENRERKKQFAVGPMSKKALGYQYDEFAKLDKSQ